VLTRVANRVAKGEEVSTKRASEVIVNRPVLKKEDITAPFYVIDVDTFAGRFGGTYRVTCAYNESPTNEPYTPDATPNGVFLVLMAANDVRDNQMKSLADAFAQGMTAMGPCKFQKVHVGSEGRESYNIVDADAEAEEPAKKAGKGTS
jgi:hypothetical protein